MKRTLFALLALAACLSACTPAASQPAGEVPAATVESAPVAEGAGKEPSASVIVTGTLCSMEDSANTGKALYVWCAAVQSDNAPALGELVEIDYAAATQRRLLDTGIPSHKLGNCFARGNKLYYTVFEDKGRTLHTMDLATGDEQTMPVEEYSVGFVDDRALYLFMTDRDVYTAMQWVDPATGTEEIIRLPAQTIRICDAAEGRFLITRLLGSVPLFALQDEEQRAAALQTATAEYAWWNPADGSLEPLFREPYYGTMSETGRMQERVYLGKAGGQFYFYRADQTETSYTNCRVERCAPDGSGAETVLVMADGQGLPGVYRQDGEIRWLIQATESGMAVYRTGEDTVRQVVGPAGSDMIWPRALTDDGRVLMADPDSSDGKTLSYRLVRQEDYLAGNFTGTDVELTEE